MNALTEAREIVAQRVIATQRQQIRKLRVQREIEAAKLRVLTLFANPMAPTLLLLAAYYLACFAMDYLPLKKEIKNA
jgi:hypothetical protein